MKINYTTQLSCVRNIISIFSVIDWSAHKNNGTKNTVSYIYTNENCNWCVQFLRDRPVSACK